MRSNMVTKVEGVVSKHRKRHTPYILVLKSAHKISRKPHFMGSGKETNKFISLRILYILSVPPIYMDVPIN